MMRYDNPIFITTMWLFNALLRRSSSGFFGIWATTAAFMLASTLLRTALRHPLRPDDAGGWGYNNVTGDPGQGSVWVNCTHTDARGRKYSDY